MSRLLGRYLSAGVLRHYALVATVTLMLASVIQYVENRDGLLDEAALTLGDILRFSLLSAPGIYVLLASFLALVAVLIFCLTLLRHSELQVMLSGGLTYGQILLGLMPAALVVAAFHFWMENSVLPQAMGELRVWGIGNLAHGREGEPDRIWLQRGTYILGADSLDVEHRELAGVDLFALRPDGGLAWHLRAEVARLDDDALVIPRAVRTTPDDQASRATGNLRIPACFKADLLAALSLPPRATPVWRLPRILDQAQGTAYPRPAYLFWLNKKVAAPLTSALAILLLAPLVQHACRLGPVRLILGGLGAGFTGFVADAVLGGLGQAGAVQPILAAWALPWLMAAILLVWPSVGDTAPVAAGARRS